MQRPEFRNEVMRLANGFAVELSNDRLEALWERYGKEDITTWRGAVNQCLCESRYPTAARLDSAVASNRSQMPQEAQTGGGMGVESIPAGYARVVPSSEVRRRFEDMPVEALEKFNAVRLEIRKARTRLGLNDADTAELLKPYFSDPEIGERCWANYCGLMNQHEGIKAGAVKVSRRADYDGEVAGSPPPEFAPF